MGVVFSCLLYIKSLKQVEYQLWEIATATSSFHISLINDEFKTKSFEKNQTDFHNNRFLQTIFSMNSEMI